MNTGPTRFGGRPDVVLALVLDCSDLERSTTFWCGVLGYEAEPDSAGPYRSLLPQDGNGIEILLQRVPDQKLTKNRLHLDLRVSDLTAETTRVLALGAKLITADPVTEHGWTWNVLADPDNNEFCVLQPPQP